MCFGCHGLGCASGEDAFWPRNRVFWLLLDSEWLSAGDPWQSRIDPECADRVVLPVAYGNAAFGTGRPRNAAWSPGERRLGTRLGPGSAVGRPRVYRDGPPSEGLSRRFAGRGSMAAERGRRCANRAYPIWVCVRSPMTEIRGSIFETGQSTYGIPPTCVSPTGSVRK